MHGSIRDRLEDLLGADSSAEHNDAAHHTSGCPDCNAKLQKMRAQAEMMRLLRAPEEVEPSAGFYARVLQRIEEQMQLSAPGTAL